MSKMCCGPDDCDDVYRLRARVEKLEKVRESLQEIMDYSGGANSALEDEYVMDRAASALADCEEVDRGTV